jgi:hypothetical protein
VSRQAKEEQMNPQLAYVHAQSHQQDLSLAAERAHRAAGVKRERKAFTHLEFSRIIRWGRRSPRTAPATHARVNVA